jgi:hypothetical protein
MTLPRERLTLALVHLADRLDRQGERVAFDICQAAAQELEKPLCATCTARRFEDERTRSKARHPSRTPAKTQREHLAGVVPLIVAPTASASPEAS